jgi:hypothetical protein
LPAPELDAALDGIARESGGSLPLCCRPLVGDGARDTLPAVRRQSVVGDFVIIGGVAATLQGIELLEL